MIPIELKFVRFSSGEYYVVFYRIKDFIPVEILPKTFWGKLFKKLFHIKKYTKNPWKTITDFVYCSGFDKWIYDHHPMDFIQDKMVLFDEIPSTKQAFRYLENVTEYEMKENKDYQKMVKLYNEKENKLKNVIY